MISSRWIASATAIVTMLALFVPGAGAQADAAAYADLEFTVVIEDAQDHVGFLDIREVAFGEPGDGTLVARFTVQDFGLHAGTEAFHFFMTTPAGGIRAGFDTSGEPATHSSSAAGFESCAVDGNTVYCVLPYESIEAEVGTVLEGTYVITYQQAAQDFAPGGYFESALLGNRGDDYTITGGDAATSVVESLKMDGALEQTVAGNGTATFDVNVTNAGADNATFNVTVANATGDLPLTLEPTSATLAANETMTVKATAEVAEDTAPGTYTWELRVDGVNGGNASLVLTLDVSAPDTPSPDGNETAGNASAEDADDGMGIPGFEAPLAAAGAVLAAFVLARRARRQG